MQTLLASFIPVETRSNCVELAAFNFLPVVFFAGPEEAVNLNLGRDL